MRSLRPGRAPRGPWHGLLAGVAIALAAAWKRRRSGRARGVEACLVTGGSVDPDVLAEALRAAPMREEPERTRF